ncbi:MAG TPA: hypothetical protein VF326_11245 [Anaerolineaceae bacterium]
MKPLLPPQPFMQNDGGRQSPQRLVVLVPDQNVDEIKFSWAIRRLAGPGNLDVLLVSIVSDIEGELAARRNLVTICSLVNEFRYNVDFRVIWDRSWIHAARGLFGPGDLFICPPEVTIRTGFRKYDPLDTAIAHTLNVPTQPLANFFTNTRRSISNIFKQILYWVMIAAILGGFFILESDASQAASGFLGQTIVVILMAFELGAIYLWSSITGY